MQRISLCTLFVVIFCATCFAQTSFQGLTPGVSTRTEVERVLGKRLDNGGSNQYSPPAGLKKVFVIYRGAVIDEIEVILMNAVSRAALVQKFNLPPKADVQTSSDKLRETFGGDALLTLSYASADPASGVIQIDYLSRALAASIPGVHLNPSTQSVAGRWSGSWTNSKGEAGESTININEQTGRITGDEDGWVIENARRSGNVLTWEYRNQNNGCRNYAVRWEISPDGRSATGSYTVKDRCEGQTYTGTYSNYRRL